MRGMPRSADKNKRLAVEEMSFRPLLIVVLVVLTTAQKQHDVISGQGVVWQPPRFPPKDLFDHDPERHHSFVNMYKF